MRKFPLRVAFERTLIDWKDDGKYTDYGWKVTILWKEQHRIRWSSTKGTTKTPPGIHQGADENCNRAITLMLWPLGHLDVWWEPHYRTDEDGICDKCRKELNAR